MISHSQNPDLKIKLCSCSLINSPDIVIDGSVVLQYSIHSPLIGGGSDVILYNGLISDDSSQLSITESHDNTWGTRLLPPVDHNDNYIIFLTDKDLNKQVNS